MSLGEKIRELRDKKTLAEFGEMFGVSGSNISQIEQGRSTPSVELSLKICDHFGVSMDWLLRGIGTREQHTIKEPDDEFKLKYIALLEKHNKFIEERMEEQHKEIREQPLHK